MGGEKFDMKTFESLQNLEEMSKYADRFLDLAGEGSSRLVYIYDSKKVIKVAKNAKGIEQNIEEDKISKDSQAKAVVANVFRVDPRHRFIVSELVKPIITNDDLKNYFEKITGASFGELANVVMKLERRPETIDEIRNEWIKSAAHVSFAYGLLPSDVLVVDHWGKTADGRMVMLDYGATKEMWEKFYSHD